jgi:hypothetical protein
MHLCSVHCRADKKEDSISTVASSLKMPAKIQTALLVQHINGPSIKTLKLTNNQIARQPKIDPALPWHFREILSPST